MHPRLLHIVSGADMCPDRRFGDDLVEVMAEEQLRGHRDEAAWAAEGLGVSKGPSGIEGLIDRLRGDVSYMRDHGYDAWEQLKRAERGWKTGPHLKLVVPSKTCSEESPE